MPGNMSTASQDLAAFTLALITSRHSVAPKRLVAPGPGPAQLQAIVEAAGCAPDHELLRPWRLIRIAPDQRSALADVFEQSLLERLPDASDSARSQAREKAFRAPELLLAVARLAPAHAGVSDAERHVALGAALQNLLLAAHGMGYAAMLTSGQSLKARHFWLAFQLGEGEQPLCLVSIGTPTEVKRRSRPSAHELMSPWAPGTLR
jgi:nitroreductase